MMPFVGLFDAFHLPCCYCPMSPSFSSAIVASKLHLTPKNKIKETENTHKKYSQHFTHLSHRRLCLLPALPSLLLMLIFATASTIMLTLLHIFELFFILLACFELRFLLFIDG
jgi:hypothetical protein